MMRLLIFMKELNVFWRQKDIQRILVFLWVLYIVTLFVMPKFEVWTLWKTTWWFFVTLSTVGYGDISPDSQFGQMWTIVLMLSGIGSLASAIPAISNYVFERRESVKNGSADYGIEVGHIILMINRDLYTIQDIIDEIYADRLRKKRKTILVSEMLESCPNRFATSILFVALPKCTVPNTCGFCI